MRLTAPLQLLIIALTAQASASPLAAPASESVEVESRDFTEFTADTAAVEKRSYQNSCSGCSISPSTGNPIMQCRCNGPGNSVVTTRLALNGCIANRSGSMSWAKNGNFGRSCNGIMLSRRPELNQIEATCDGPGSSVQFSFLTLNGRIHNRNGHLAC